MMVFVVPVFQDMFSSNPGGLPASTQMVVNISDFMRNPLKGGALAITLISTFLILSFSIKKSYKFTR